MITHFQKATILRHHQLIEGDLWVVNGKIAPPQKVCDQKITLQGLFIAPGFIDLQLNGAFGDDFTSQPDQVAAVAKKLVQFGITGFLATMVSSSPEHYRHAVPIINKAIGKTEGAELLGIHLEGPCFNPLQTKAHHSGTIKSCGDFENPEACYGELSGVKIITLAPELPGALKWIKWLSDHKLIASAGHSMATFQQMEQAIEAGLSMATHLFNAMRPFHHREPGPVGSALMHEGFYYSVIADGRHVHPAALEFAWRSQPKGLLLVSDGTAALGAPLGQYRLGEMAIRSGDDGVHLLSGGTLSGTMIGLNKMVSHFKHFTSASLVEALEAASLKPAKALGLYPRKGSLDIGADADFVVLDEHLDIISCYVAGQRSYSS